MKLSPRCDSFTARSVLRRVISIRISEPVHCSRVLPGTEMGSSSRIVLAALRVMPV